MLSMYTCQEEESSASRGAAVVRRSLTACPLCLMWAAACAMVPCSCWPFIAAVIAECQHKKGLPGSDASYSAGTRAQHVSLQGLSMPITSIRLT